MTRIVAPHSVDATPTRFWYAAPVVRSRPATGFAPPWQPCTAQVDERIGWTCLAKDTDAVPLHEHALFVHVCVPPPPALACEPEQATSTSAAPSSSGIVRSPGSRKRTDREPERRRCGGMCRGSVPRVSGRLEKMHGVAPWKFPSHPRPPATLPDKAGPSGQQRGPHPRTRRDLHHPTSSNSCEPRRGGVARL